MVVEASAVVVDLAVSVSVMVSTLTRVDSTSSAMEYSDGCGRRFEG